MEKNTKKNNNAYSILERHGFIKKHLIIGWLYPELMSTYGDQGNVRILRDRAEGREISAEVRIISLESPAKDIAEADLLFMGGAQDQYQKIVSEDLWAKKNELGEAIERGVPGLYVCGAYQLLGKHYAIGAHTKIEGLGIFDCHTENPGTGKRMIGNIALQAEISELSGYPIIGFENHGGKTYLGASARPFGRVLKGFGNNGEDKAEGIFYKNNIGTYLHGPILSKNPELADWLIGKAYEVKYKEALPLVPLDDSFENKARAVLFKRANLKNGRQGEYVPLSGL